MEEIEELVVTDEKPPEGFNLDAEASREGWAAQSGMTERADGADLDLADVDPSDGIVPDDDAVDDPDHNEPLEEDI